eukprot:7046875-Prymnesium_polylepis.1
MVSDTHTWCRTRDTLSAGHSKCRTKHMCRGPGKQMRASQHALLPSRPLVCMLDTFAREVGASPRQ